MLKPLAATALLAFFALPAIAAPMQPFRPADFCGSVHSVKWLPPKSTPPVHGMSGSARRQRNWPGRSVVVLGDVTGLDSEHFRLINALLTTSNDGADVALAPGELLLVLTDTGPDQLDNVSALCITGFIIKGDEGGTWTRYETLETTDRQGG
jgi:hypothetical protein